MRGREDKCLDNIWSDVFIKGQLEKPHKAKLKVQASYKAFSMCRCETPTNKTVNPHFEHTTHVFDDDMMKVCQVQSLSPFA